MTPKKVGWIGPESYNGYRKGIWYPEKVGLIISITNLGAER